METHKQFIKRKNEEFKKGKPVRTVDIGRQARHLWQREAWTFMPHYNLKDKVFIIERLKRIKIEGKPANPRTAKIGDIEYRFGYYIIGKKGRAKDKWVWGQYCPFIPRRDFKKLINKAQKEGTIK